MLNELRFITGAILLIISAYTDIRTRTAPNTLWLILGSISILFLSIDFAINGIDPLKILIILAFIGAFYLLYQLHLISGGADTKALICLTLLIGVYVFDVFLISLYITLLTVILIHLIKKEYTLRYLFMGYKYPFLASLFISFIVTYVVTDGWNTTILMKLLTLTH